MGEVIVFATAAIAGYVAGSVSSARLLARWLLPGQELSTTAWDIDGTGVIVTRGVSPSAIGSRAGHRWGCVTALLDIAKAFLVTLVIAVISPASAAPAAAALTSAATVLGHAYPVFHRFEGGWGQSPIMGSVLVLDWVALPLAVMGGSLTGVLIGDALMAFAGWPIFLVPFAIWRGDPVLIGWALFVNLVYWWRVMPVVRQHIRNRQAAPRPWRERVAAILRNSR